MILICISNDFYSANVFTIGKKYDCDDLNSKIYYDLYQTKNDLGLYCLVPRCAFITMAKYRELKLKRILK